MGADWPLIILEDGALEDEDEDEVVDGSFWAWTWERDAGGGMQALQKAALQLRAEQTQSSVLLIKGASHDIQVFPVQWEKCRSFVQVRHEGGFENEEVDWTHLPHTMCVTQAQL
jgi:hypothetical protein